MKKRKTNFTVFGVRKADSISFMRYYKGEKQWNDPTADTNEKNAVYGIVLFGGNRTSTTRNTAISNFTSGNNTSKNSPDSTD